MNGSCVEAENVAQLKLNYATKLFYDEYRQNKEDYEPIIKQLHLYSKNVKGYFNDNATISTQQVNIKAIKPDLDKFIGFDIESVPIRIDLPQTLTTKEAEEEKNELMPKNGKMETKMTRMSNINNTRLNGSNLDVEDEKVCLFVFFYILVIVACMSLFLIDFSFKLTKFSAFIWRLLYLLAVYYICLYSV